MTPKIPVHKWQWMVILGCLAAGVFILGSFFDVGEEPVPFQSGTPPEEPAAKSSMEQWTMKDYEEYYENSLTEILEEIVGVGDVTVMVNVDSTEERVFQKNIRTGNQVTNEKDNQGGSRTINDNTRDEEVVTIADGDNEQPVVVKTLKPAIRGVVVVAKGAENTQVKMWIIDVVQRALGVPSHRISVVPKKGS